MIPKTAFLGLSHLGIVSSICWASLQRPTMGYDLDAAVVDSLREARIPLHEPGLEALFQRSRAHLSFSADPATLKECSIVAISQDVPTNDKNESNPVIVDRLVDAALPFLQQGVALVLMSQVPVGFCRRLEERVRAGRPDLAFSLTYWVETLVIGNAVERFLRPGRIILGSSGKETPVPEQLDVPLAEFGCPLFKMSYESAELAKMAINLYLSYSVTYANTMADFCEAVGADWSQIVPALRSDARIGLSAYIRPGLGIAGGNLERDLTTLQRLAASHHLDSRVLHALIEYNERRPQWVERQLQDRLFATQQNPTICIWGLAYKKGTNSTRNSIAIRLIQDLKSRARIHVYDPVARLPEEASGPEVFDDKYAAVEHADCLAIMTDWDEFKATDNRILCQRMKRPLVIDCVNVLIDPSGLEYVGIGRMAQ